MFKKSNLSDELALNMENILSGQVEKDETNKLEKSALKNELNDCIEMLENFNVKASEILKTILKNVSTDK